MVWAMFLSGALGGLAGAVEVLGVHCGILRPAFHPGRRAQSQLPY